MKKISSFFALCLLVFVHTNIAKADLLDEEDEPIVTPKNPEQKPSETDPSVPPKSKTDVSKPTPVKPDAPSIPPKKPATKPGKPKPGKTGEPEVREPVHFESKGLRGLREQGTVELIEDVIVTQGDLRMEADRAQIYYDENQKEVEKVVAVGNVKMFNVDKSTGEKMKAYCNQVQFLNKDRTVIMEGNARLWRGTQSVIRGKKITYEIDTGWIKADRVAGELQPEEKKK